MWFALDNYSNETYLYIMPTVFFNKGAASQSNCLRQLLTA